MKIWLIGAGQMAIDYYRVIEKLGYEVIVFGRGKESAVRFEESCRRKVNLLGIESESDAFCSEDLAIVAVPISNLYSVTSSLLNIGFKKILLEKPGSLTLSEIDQLKNQAKLLKASIYIAYNRRHYLSVRKAKQIIEDDGGATSCTFEISEWSHVIKNLKIEAAVKEKWLIANSSHVVDLAFYLTGEPKSLHAEKCGTLDWHPPSARFSGSGITVKGCIFSYIGDWEGVGRWGVEVSTRNHRLILKPLERLVIVKAKSTKNINYEMDYSLDELFKPGLFHQVDCFIRGELSEFSTIEDQEKLFKTIYKIAGYT